MGTLNKVLFLIDNNIQYFADNQFNILIDKNINNVTVEDFTLYGVDPLTIELEDNKNITILSTTDMLTYKILQNPAIIYNFLDNRRFNIQKIKKLIINDIGNIVYMVHNGEHIYTWRNNEWGKYHCNMNIFSTQDVSNIIKYGMNSMTINNISESEWQKLYSVVDSYKYINFLAILNPQNIEDKITLKNIEIIKDSFMKQIEIKDYMFEEENMPKELILTWNTTNKSKIKIIYVM